MELPITVERKCPIDIGLAMLGDDISIGIYAFSPIEELPKLFFCSITSLIVVEAISFLCKKKLTYGP